MYIAEKGQGAFAIGPNQRDNFRLRVSPRTEFADAVIGCGVPHAGRGDHGRFIRELAGVMPRCAGIRRMGAAALDLAMVASGKLEGFWERNLSPWDMAAGIILVREAGGFVSAADGTGNILTTRSIIAGNEAAHAALAQVITAA
jgi:myo-inositol-1(or 4)-monophosphatase